MWHVKRKGTMFSIPVSDINAHEARFILSIFNYIIQISHLYSITLNSYFYILTW